MIIIICIVSLILALQVMLMMRMAKLSQQNKNIYRERQQELNQEKILNQLTASEKSVMGRFYSHKKHRIKIMPPTSKISNYTFTVWDKKDRVICSGGCQTRYDALDEAIKIIDNYIEENDQVTNTP